MKIKWYNKVTRANSKILKDLRQLCKFYQTKVIFQNRKGDCSGHANLKRDTIYVYLYDSDEVYERETFRSLISTVMHELGHILNKRNKKYYPYHSYGENYTVENSKYIIRHGYNAELYTDRVGKQLMNLHYPSIPYERGYGIGCKKDHKWYKESYLHNYKNYLNARRKKK